MPFVVLGLRTPAGAMPGMPNTGAGGMGSALVPALPLLLAAGLLAALGAGTLAWRRARV